MKATQWTLNYKTIVVWMISTLFAVFKSHCIKVIDYSIRVPQSSAMNTSWVRQKHDNQRKGVNYYNDNGLHIL